MDDSLAAISGTVTGSPSVSVVVVAYNMPRELPRTLASLSRRMQRDVTGLDYETLVVDNGSDPPAVTDEEGVAVLRVPDPRPSPARAVGIGIAATRGDLVGVMIDGARLASPGLIAHVVMASRLHPRPVIATLGFHLGPDVQQRSIRDGYGRDMEDELLASSGWESDGYRLFEISVFAQSSGGGWFMPIAESNALFMRRSMWRELGGYDEGFESPGGGYVNLDTYARACSLPDSRLIILLGEGTFHQVHGGVATNNLQAPDPAFHHEYRRLRGRSFSPPKIDPLYLGRISQPVLRSIRVAAELAIGPARGLTMEAERYDQGAQWSEKS